VSLAGTTSQNVSILFLTLQVSKELLINILDEYRQLTLKAKLDTVLHHPSILKDFLAGRSSQEIRDKIRELRRIKVEKHYQKEVFEFIKQSKKSSSYQKNSTEELKLNKLCCIEDWQIDELRRIIYDLQKGEQLGHRNDIHMRERGLIHRKDWEWAMSVIAMRRFGKLNENSSALGVGAGKEILLFYLANHLGHVFATDLYAGEWSKIWAPPDMIKNATKYAPFEYKESALTVMRMDSTNLEFLSETFDIAFSISSIEHFGGNNHSGALQSLKEIERVLKRGGIATVTTEYILNDKEAPDLQNQFFNRKTIYSDLIDKLDELQLVEPLDLGITPNTLDTVMDVGDGVKWDTDVFSYEYKKTNPLIVLRTRNILLTSVMLVFQKR
jgi:SAM-dependent methyltransferase